MGRGARFARYVARLRGRAAGLEILVLGQGTRLFPDAGPDVALDVVDSRTDTKGVTIQVYRPAGRPVYRPAPGN